jgi:hypothetical protein
LDAAAAWIRQRSRQLHQECQVEDQRYLDVGELGFHDAMEQARRYLLEPSPPGED